MGISSATTRRGERVADRRVILDANILARAVLEVRARELVERYAAAVALYGPDTAIVEMQEHLPAIFAKRQWPAARAMVVFEALRVFIQELPGPFYADQEDTALARLCTGA